MSDRDIAVSVFARLGNLDAARSDAADLAWDHAKSVAQQMGFSMGSEQHLLLHETLATRYEHSVEHLMFFMQHAFVTLRAMFDSGVINLSVEDGPLADSEVCERIGFLSQMLCSSYMYLSAGYETLWPNNSDMPDELVTLFHFTEREVDSSNITEEEEL